MKNKMKNVKELPDEIWLNVMKYCSTSDILRQAEKTPQTLVTLHSTDPPKMKEKRSSFI